MVIAIFFSLDRVLKKIALNLNDTHKFKFIGDFFSFHFVANNNIAFSLPLNGQLATIIITFIIALLLFFIIYLLINKEIINKKERPQIIILLSIIFAGALSNLVDRLVYGYVIDYLDLKYFTVFNIADVLISGAAIWLILKNLKNK